jgi:hypothetical protein
MLNSNSNRALEKYKVIRTESIKDRDDLRIPPQAGPPGGPATPSVAPGGQVAWWLVARGSLALALPRAWVSGTYVPGWPRAETGARPARAWPSAGQLARFALQL